MMNDNLPSDLTELPPERPWIGLASTYDVEAWIDSYNRDLQRHVTRPHAGGHGICFRLTHGGELFLHTTAEGEIVLDVTPQAAWAAPVMAAATGIEAPSTQIWPLPGELLTQLIWGLNSLIASVRPVLGHDFRIRKY